MPQNINYTPKGAALELFRCHNRELMLAGPANTGKTLAVCMYLHAQAEQHPNTRILMIRKTRRSLTEAAQQKLEDHILRPLNHPAAAGDARRTNRHSYRYPNASEIVLGGLDEPTRYYSTEWSIVYVNEASELTLDEWERFNRSIRHRSIPHPTRAGECLNQIIGDTNPDAPTHWILQRANAGSLKLLHCQHSDNPTFSRQDQEALDALTGVRRARLRDGLWVGAEGQIWDNFRADLHITDDCPRDGNGAPRFKMVVMGQDWGFRGPGCLQVWGVDHDGCMWLLNEWYAAGYTIDWWVRKAADAYQQWATNDLAPVKVICDAADPGSIELYRRAGLPAEEADKTDRRASLDQVYDRLQPDRYGRVRLKFVRGFSQITDESLKAKYQPTSVVEEIPGYVWRKHKDGQVVKEEPEPTCADHGCDAMRYVVRYVDRHHPGGGILHADAVVGAQTHGHGEEPEEYRLLRGERYDEGAPPIRFPWQS